MLKLISFICLLFTGIVVAPDFTSAGTPGCPSGYGDYFYGAHHSLAGDYVFRTQKVYSTVAEGKNFSSFNPFSTIIRERQTKQTASPVETRGTGFEFRDKIQELGKLLVSNAREELDEDYTVIVTTFVNLNDLYRTSSLGRYISEQLVSEFQQAGLNIIEIRKSPSIMISKDFGEYGLSRDMEELDFVHQAQALVVGTYTFSDGKLFLNARLLQNRDGLILSSGSLAFNIDSVAAGFLADEGSPAPVVPGATVGLRKLVK